MNLGRISAAASVVLLVTTNVWLMKSAERNPPSSQDRLSGVWELRMEAGFRSQPDSIVGLISLSTLPRPLTGVWVSMSPASHAGVFSADLERVGVGSLMQPIVGARMYATDSVRIALNPATDHGAVLFLGILDGDSIQGRWYETGYSGGESGLFRLARVASRLDWARIGRYYYENRQR